MIKELLSKVSAGQDLTYDESKTAIDEIMSGKVGETITASFLTAIAMKGETDDEIAGAAYAMRSKATPFHIDGDALDIVGTGGDKSNSFNISTVSAFIAAAAGIKIAKHGNRSASSKCGTADCLEALGAKIDCDTEVMQKAFNECNMAFLFAQKYHSAMRFVGPVRKEIGIRTVFNILGPLTNPAHANQMVLGVFDKAYVMKIAKALVKLGVTDAFVVYGIDCLDEISASDSTYVAEVRNGNITDYEIKPEDFGFEKVNKKDLLGSTPEENAKIVKKILLGEGTSAQNTAVALNAGACIYVSQKDISFNDAVENAKQIIASGKAYKVLEDFVKITNSAV